HRTLLDEHFRIKGRTTWYESVEQMQTDLDSYLEHYNTQRPHQGRMMEGQTPYSMFKKGLKLIPKEVRTKEGANKSLGTKTHHSKLLILNG
ncbi:integrase core domain-containing protein, partial [Aeromonas caviae]|uniref:integrase core domain-containing protein n=1 Tax=Aeromonas caviae TaxID=648 RepID=UPI003EC6A376